MTWAQPRVSTAVRRRMMALRLDILVTPMESTTVTTAARPSGYGGDGQGDGDHEAVEDDLRTQPAGAQDLHGEDDDADAEDEPGEDLGQLAELYLQRGLALLGAGEGVGNLAHLGVHAGGGDDGGAAAVGDGGAHVAHVLAVAQGHVGSSP